MQAGNKDLVDHSKEGGRKMKSTTRKAVYGILTPRTVYGKSFVTTIPGVL